ncbi:uncharacterized protein LOC141588644 [Silene latifolia]|uniref:uncharacterized protein LOC141588644 n=1 Tax=Silene latifolia TaxID=37657 RepID=UPI003D773572
MIEGYKPLRDKNDCHIWAFDKSECYTAKTFVDAFYNLKYNGAERKPWFSRLWKGLAPPRHEIILWAILWNKVNTKDRMLKWKEMAWKETMCTFCCEDLETAKHLFLHCRYSWKLWTSICEAWDMAWICPGGIDDAFLIWCDSHFVGFEKRLWDVFFIAIVTIIWELRNEAIFENKTPNWPCIVDKLFLRVGLWCKSWKEGLPYTLEEWLNNWKIFRTWKEKMIGQRTTPRLEF